MKRIDFQSPASIDAIHSSVLNLIHLLDTANLVLNDLDYGKEQQNNADLQRVAALFDVAQGCAEEIDRYIETHYSGLIGRVAA